MAGKKRVALWGQPQRSTTVEEGATVGAVVGRDLRWPDGSVVTRAELVPVAAAPASPSTPAPAGQQTVNVQSGATYTAVAGDVGNVIAMTNSGSNSVTIPTGIGDAGATIELWCRGAGQTTVVADTGVTIGAPYGGTLVLAGQGAACSLRCFGSDAWGLVGQVEAAP